MNATREDNRRRHLLSMINEKKRERKLVEVFVGTMPGAQQEVARSLTRFGEVEHVYECVPYVSMLMETEQAEKLYAWVHSASARSGIAIQGVDLEVITSVYYDSVVKKVPSPKQTRGEVLENVKVKGGLWGLDKIGAYQAQKISDGSEVRIAIVDTGIDYNHVQLRSRFWDGKGVDLVDGGNDPMDEEGHGTHVAGTACSDDYGVSLESQLLGVRVLDSMGSGRESDVIAGIEWCLKNDIDVVNMSLGSRYASGAFEQICSIAYNRGVVLVAAAGNEGKGPSYPASFDESVIAVAAVDINLEHADFSNIYDTNDISAPGVDILSCHLGGGVEYLSGTSMATPHVTGTMALALSLAARDPSTLEEIMDESAKHLDYDGREKNQHVFGSGLIKADTLLSMLVSKKVRQLFAKRYSNR